ncbi:Helicase [Plasmodium coatneyi]|uniref:Helicase n=1 Tax=Plasmodium coatneyi TaxID=208452 RepID=A0A1B1DYD9_9APIC|nr:Helicase [Plasmodium coatneyi]ANQ07760.1 Helicase [Plasmodium coatneyi]
MNGEEESHPTKRLEESNREGYHHHPMRRPNETHFRASERGPQNVPCESTTAPLQTYYHQENDQVYSRQETLLPKWGNYQKDSFGHDQSWDKHAVEETQNEQLWGGHQPNNDGIGELPYRDAQNGAIFNSFMRVPLNVDQVRMSRGLPHGGSMHMNNWIYHPTQNNQHMVRADHHAYAGMTGASVPSSSGVNTSGGFPTGYDPRAVGSVHPSVGLQQGYPPCVDNPNGAREGYCAIPGNNTYAAESLPNYNDQRRGSYGQYGGNSGGENPKREAVNRRRYQPSGGGVRDLNGEFHYRTCADEGDSPYGVNLYRGGNSGNHSNSSKGNRFVGNRFQKARPAAPTEGNGREVSGPGGVKPKREKKIPLTEDSQKSAQRNIQKLSIYKSRSEILKMIEQNDITFIQGETGSGKSTCVPKFLLEQSLKEGKEKINIIVTEPRRIACISLSRILSELMNEKLGNRIGYRIAGEAVYDNERTVVTYITVGFLFKLFLHHRNMYKKFTHIVIDEIHDRSILLDIVLLFIKVYLHSRRKDEKIFKLIIMSATMQSNLFHSYFEHENISIGSIYIGTKIYSIDTFYIEDIIRYAREGGIDEQNQSDREGGDKPSSGGSLEHPPRCEKVIEFILRRKNRTKLHLSRRGEALLQRIKNEYDKSISLFNSKNAQSESNKDIDVEQIIPANVFSNISELCLELVHNLCLLGDSVLIFLSGMQDITDMYHQLCILINNNANKHKVRYHIHILHSCLYDNTIHKLHESDRDIINIFLSSNIAESSITIPNVRLVIDFCIQKNIEYNSDRRAHILVKKWINKSSMEQRKGRCGRTCHGICIRMISKNFLNLLKDHKVSEVYTHSLHLLYLYILKSMSVLGQLIRGSNKASVQDIPPDDGSTTKVDALPHNNKLTMHDVLSMIIEKPSREKIRSTRHELEKMKAVIKIKDKLVISIIGQIMIRFNMSIYLCRLLLFGVVMDVTFDAIIIASIINTNDIFPSFNLFTSKSVYSYGVSLEASLKQKQYFDGKTYSEPIMLRNVFIEWLCVFSLYVQDLKNQNNFVRSHLKSYYVTTCTIMSKRNNINAKKLLSVISSVNNLCRRLLKILNRDSNAYRSAVYLLDLLKGEIPPTSLSSELSPNGGVDETLNWKNVFRVVTKYARYDPSNENLYLKFLFSLAFTPLFIHGSPHLPIQTESEKKPKGKKLLALLNYMTQQKLNVKNCIYFRAPHYDLNILRRALFIMCPYLSFELLRNKNFYIIHFLDQGGVNKYLNESIPLNGVSSPALTEGEETHLNHSNRSNNYGVLVGPELGKVLSNKANQVLYEGTIEQIRRELLHMYGKDVERNIFFNFHENIIRVVEPVQAIVPVHVNQKDEINNASLCTNIINMFSSGRHCFSIPMWKGSLHGGSHYRSGASRVSNYFNHNYEMNKPKHLFLVKWTLLNTDNYKISKREKAERELRRAERQAQKLGKNNKGQQTGECKDDNVGCTDFRANQCEEDDEVGEDEAPPKRDDQNGANSEEQKGEAALSNCTSDCSDLSNKGKKKKMKCNLNFKSVLGFLSLCPFDYDAEKGIYKRQTQDVFAVCSSIDYSCTNDTYTWVNYATVIPNKYFLSFFLSSLPYHDNVILNTRTNLRGFDVLSVKIFDSKEIVILDVRKKKSKGGDATTAEGDNRGIASEETNPGASQSALTINKYDLLRINYLRYCLSTFLFFLTWVYNNRDEEEYRMENNALGVKRASTASAGSAFGQASTDRVAQPKRQSDSTGDYGGDDEGNGHPDVTDEVNEPDEYFSEDDAMSDVEENRVLRESPYISRVIQNLIEENNREEINYDMYAVGQDDDGDGPGDCDGTVLPNGRERGTQFNLSLLHANEDLATLDAAWNDGKGEHLLKMFDHLYSYLSSPNDPSLANSPPREKSQTCLSSVKKCHLNNSISLQILQSVNAYAKGCTSEEFLFFSPINLGPMEDLNYRLRCMYYEECTPDRDTTHSRSNSQ